jgi:O-antigen ligase
MTPQPPRRARPLALLGWLLLAGLVLLSALPKASTIVFTWPWAFYAQALLLAPVFLLALARWGKPARPRPAGIAGLLLATAIGVSVLTSQRPQFSFEAALPLWSGLVWMAWVTATVRPRCAHPLHFLRFARLVGLLMLVPLGLSAAFYGAELVDLMAAAGTWRIELTYHRNWYPLGHWNYTGGLALLALPWLGTLAWADRGWWRPLWGAGVLTTAAVFFSASSRGAVLGALLGGGTAGLLWLAQHRPTRRQLLLAGSAAVVLAGGLLASNPRLLNLALHPAQTFQPNEGDVQRLGMAQAGWLLGQQRPWLGHGPGMVPFVYPEVRAQVVGGVETSYQLHNGPLHWWVTTGFLGMAALGVLSWAALRALRRWQHTPPAGTSRLFALASGCTLVAYAGLFLTDYQLDVIALVALLGLHAGVLFASPDETTQQPTRRLPALALGLAGAVALLLLVPHWRARYLHWNALAETPAAERVLLGQRLLEAATIAPWNPHYLNDAGFQFARAAQEKPDPKLRTLARRVLDASLALDPAQEPVHAALGWLWLPDDPAPARRHFETARQLLPDRPSNNLGLALACLGQEDTSAAIHALALELLVNPIFIASPYWQQEPLSGYRDAAYAHWQTLIARALVDPRLPDWRRPTLSYTRAAVHWWREGVLPSPADLAGATPEQRAVFADLAQPSRDATALPQLYRALQAALARPNEAQAILAPVFGADTPALANALDRLAANPTDLAALLRAPNSPRAALTRNALERAHYALMQHNLDGPGYADLAPYLDDLFLARNLAPLFPPRGYMPSYLLADLAQRPAARAAH